MARSQPNDNLSAPAARPLLLVDVDGVISLFGFQPDRRPEGSFHWIDGVPHFISAMAGEHLLALGECFELVWASGWEEKANEYLPGVLGLPGALPFLTFERSPGRANAHWKLSAIDAYAKLAPLAWVDDAFNEACHRWASARQAPTLLVETEPALGLTGAERSQLLDWAEAEQRQT